MDFTIFEHEIDVLTPTLIAAQKLLTEIPAIAPESGGDGESKKAAALLAFLKELGFSNFEQYPAPDSRVSSGASARTFPFFSKASSRNARFG